MATSRTSAVTTGLIVAVTILSISVLGLVAIVVWRELYSTPGQSSTNTSSNLTVVKDFPGFFRTPEEQRSYEAAHFVVAGQSMPVYIYNVSSNYSACFQSCSASSTTTFAPYAQPSPLVGASPYASAQLSSSFSACSIDQRSRLQLTFHACCISRPTFFAPNELPAGTDPRGTPLKIVQFSGQKQYFQKEECCQAAGCSVCQCSQAYTIVTAVVESENANPRYRTDLVQVPGCCKCINKSA